MAAKDPERWKEPLSRGLWAYDTLLGVAPRWLLAVHLILGTLTLMYSFRWAYAMALFQGGAMALTKHEPEWFEILKGWLSEPEDIEP
jgi:TRAP-type C4-dicarboxylate transport system permease small subunit